MAFDPGVNNDGEEIKDREQGEDVKRGQRTRKITGPMCQATKCNNTQSDRKSEINTAYDT